MNQIEDKLLVRGFLLTRSEMLFRQLYRRHTTILYRLALLLLNKDAGTTGDVLQETWIRAIEGLPDFKWKSSLRTWLCGILVNCCREHYRKQQLHFHTLEELEISVANRSLDARIDLQNALVLLPPGYREVLILHDLEGFKHEEISRLLHISEGTSKSQLFHARKAIRRILN